LKKFLLYLVVFVVLFTLSMLIHEAGHAITTLVLGGTVSAVYVYPGIEILPDLGRRYEGGWPGGGAVIFGEGAPDWEEWEWGLVRLMGSGLNLLLAIAALVVFLALRPSGIWKVIVAVESLMLLDILVYSALPWLGGHVSEPVRGAEMLGISPGLFTACVLLVSVVMTSTLITVALRRSRTSAVSAQPQCTKRRSQPPRSN